MKIIAITLLISATGCSLPLDGLGPPLPPTVGVSSDPPDPKLGNDAEASTAPDVVFDAALDGGDGGGSDAASDDASAIVRPPPTNSPYNDNLCGGFFFLPACPDLNGGDLDGGVE
jgi:hypothetical protein